MKGERYITASRTATTVRNAFCKPVRERVKRSRRNERPCITYRTKLYSTSQLSFYVKGCVAFYLATLMTKKKGGGFLVHMLAREREGEREKN